MIPSYVIKGAEFTILFSVLVAALYRARKIENDPDAYASGNLSTSWVLPYSIMSVATGVLADVLENHLGITTWLNETLGQSDIVGWELIYFIAGVPLALLAEKIADKLYRRSKHWKMVNAEPLFEVNPNLNIRVNAQKQRRKPLRERLRKELKKMGLEKSLQEH